jgi:leucyl-tRNA synthetase
MYLTIYLSNYAFIYLSIYGPLEAVKPWQTNQLPGVVRFRDRVFNLATNSNISNNEPNGELLRDMNKTIKKVTNDIEKLSFNTAISNLMIYSNTLNNYKSNNGSIPKKAIEALILLLSPFAPHIW